MLCVSLHNRGITRATPLWNGFLEIDVNGLTVVSDWPRNLQKVASITYCMLRPTKPITLQWHGKQIAYGLQHEDCRIFLVVALMFIVLHRRSALAVIYRIEMADFFLFSIGLFLLLFFFFWSLLLMPEVCSFCLSAFLAVPFVLQINDTSSSSRASPRLERSRFHELPPPFSVLGKSPCRVESVVKRMEVCV